MTHPIVQKFLKGENDAGGTIHALELKIERLEKVVAKLERRRLTSVPADTAEARGVQLSGVTADGDVLPPCR